LEYGALAGQFGVRASQVRAYQVRASQVRAYQVRARFNRHFQTNLQTPAFRLK